MLKSREFRAIKSIKYILFFILEISYYIWIIILQYEIFSICLKTMKAWFIKIKIQIESFLKSPTLWYGLKQELSLQNHAIFPLNLNGYENVRIHIRYKKEFCWWKKFIIHCKGTFRDIKLKQLPLSLKVLRFKVKLQSLSIAF